MPRGLLVIVLCTFVACGGPARPVAPAPDPIVEVRFGPGPWVYEVSPNSRSDGQLIVERDLDGRWALSSSPEGFSTFPRPFPLRSASSLFPLGRLTGAGRLLVEGDQQLMTCDEVRDPDRVQLTCEFPGRRVSGWFNLSQRAYDSLTVEPNAFGAAAGASRSSSRVALTLDLSATAALRRARDAEAEARRAGYMEPHRFQPMPASGPVLQPAPPVVTLADAEHALGQGNYEVAYEFILSHPNDPRSLLPPLVAALAEACQGLESVGPLPPRPAVTREVTAETRRDALVYLLQRLTCTSFGDDVNAWREFHQEMTDRAYLDWAVRGLAAESFVWTRYHAISAIDRIGSRAALEALVPLLTEPDLDVRRKAAGVLARHRDPRAAPALVGLLDAHDFELRRAAIEWLGHFSGSPFGYHPGDGRLERAPARGRWDAWLEWFTYEFLGRPATM